MSNRNKSAQYTATIKKALSHLEDGDEDTAYTILTQIKDASAKYTVAHIIAYLHDGAVNKARRALSNVADLTAKYIIKRALSYIDVGDIHEAHWILYTNGDELVKVTTADHMDMSVKYIIAINKAFCYLEDGLGFKASVVLNKALMKQARRTPMIWRKKKMME